MNKKKQKCYCDLKEEGMEVINKDIPEGYCCLCSRCNRPGHIRFDSSGTAIYALCDECFRMDKAMKVVKVLGFVVLVIVTAFFHK